MRETIFACLNCLFFMENGIYHLLSVAQRLNTFGRRECKGGEAFLGQTLGALLSRYLISIENSVLYVIWLVTTILVCTVMVICSRTETGSWIDDTLTVHSWELLGFLNLLRLLSFCLMTWFYLSHNSSFFFSLLMWKISLQWLSCMLCVVKFWEGWDVCIKIKQSIIQREEGVGARKTGIFRSINCLAG